MRARRWASIAAAVGVVGAGALVPMTAEAANLQTVCNSPNSETWIIPAVLNSNGTYTIGSRTVNPGECLQFDNYNGRGRIFIPTSARSYKQGRDGLGWDPCVNAGGVYSNPHNDPPNQINRYKTYDNTGCG